MKKRFLILLFAVLVCLTSVVSVSANEDNPRLFDGADILTTSEVTPKVWTKNFWGFFIMGAG